MSGKSHRKSSAKADSLASAYGKDHNPQAESWLASLKALPILLKTSLDPWKLLFSCRFCSLCCLGAHVSLEASLEEVADLLVPAPFHASPNPFWHFTRYWTVLSQLCHLLSVLFCPMDNYLFHLYMCNLLYRGVGGIKVSRKR